MSGYFPLTDDERQQLREMSLPGAWYHPLVRRLLAENDAMRAALDAIAETPCGLPGHAVAVGCGANVVAYEALHQRQVGTPSVPDGRVRKA